MKLSTRCRYATRILTRMAMDGSGGPVNVPHIAGAEAISPHYVEQILTRLKAAGLVHSHRGVGGGFSLARDAGSITVADVMEAADGPVALVPCLRGDCRRSTACAARNVWRRAEEALDGTLRGTTIGDLAEEARRLESGRSLTFEI